MENNIIDLEDVTSDIPVPEGKTLRCFKQLNAGKITLMTSMSIIELNHHSEVANDRMEEDQQSQRPLNQKHASEIALYIIRALLDAAINRLPKQGKPVNEKFYEIQKDLVKQNYYSIPPIVANLRNKGIEHLRQWQSNNEVVCHWIVLEVGDQLMIIDGQHRRKAIDDVISFLKYVNANHKYPGKGGLINLHKDRLSSDELTVWNQCREMCAFCKIGIEIHLGLDVQEERQLFYDLNSHAKKVDISLATKFDSSNPLNNFGTEVLENDLFDSFQFTVTDTSNEADWDDEKPSITRRSLTAINSILFLNRTNPNGAKGSDVDEFRATTATEFWSFVLSIPGFLEKKPKSKTVAAQPVVLKAIAKLYFDFFFGKNETLNNESNQKKLKDGLKTFDFTHENAAWRYYLLTQEERNNLGLSKLAEFLPLDGEGYNRDMGGFDPVLRSFRFGAKHNDIAPLIGDIIRWHCDLPSRQK
jgi:hypothetical protein